MEGVGDAYFQLYSVIRAECVPVAEKQFTPTFSGLPFKYAARRARRALASRISIFEYAAGLFTHNQPF